MNHVSTKYPAIAYQLSERTQAQRVPQEDGGDKWKVSTGTGLVLGKDGVNHYEPRPSSRTDEFIELTRWDTVDEAIQFWESHAPNQPQPEAR